MQQLMDILVGGKSGTSEPDPNKPEEGYVASFLAISPIENPGSSCFSSFV